MTTLTSPNYKKSWTPERRRKQRERIMQNKPWLKSTGPTTEDGKKASSQNARSNFANLACAELDKKKKKQVKLLKKLSNLDFEQDLQDIENEITGIKKILGSGTTRKPLKQTNK